MENSLHFQVPAFLSRSWKYFVVVGLIIALMGIGAVALPMLAGMTVSTIVGVALLISGSVQIYHAFAIKGWKTKVWYVCSALLYIVGGLFILLQPLEGLITITMLMIIIMILNGFTRLFFGLSNRNLPSSNVIVLSGIVSVLIGSYFLMLLNDPLFSLTLLGIFIGVSLLLEGVSFIFIGFKMRKSTQND